ncbi:MAG: mechanosensitive ion channel, partial [Symploca sp. SIO2E6]|nr:mechanosensitive ion channel [Symploca sp. SIO2E6]
MNQSLLIWGSILIFGFPILTIVLGQIGDSLKRREHPFAPFVRNLQYLVLPPLVLLLIIEQILGWKELVVFLQILETLLWLAVIYTILSLLRVVLTLDEKYYPWQIPVANLFFQVIRATVILVLVGYALAEVWKIDISKAAQAFGIGSLVIALALQDTLSNLVSGFLLLADSPFKKGDWLQLGDIDGQVIDMNWRSVRLKTVEGNVVIIPNGSLGKERILNYSLPDTARGVWIDVAFSNDDPPNRVKQLLQQVLWETQGTDLEKGFKIISTGSFDDFSISYKVMFMAKDFMST